MSEEKIYSVPAQLAESAVIDAASYEAMYQRSCLLYTSDAADE